MVLYGKDEFNPRTIVFQILSLQAIFYIILGVAQLVLVAPYSGKLTPKSLFEWKTTVGFDTFQGYMVTGSYGLTSLLMSVAIWKIVKRMKKCADFCFTVYFVHFASTCVLSGFPLSIPWWICLASSFAITALLSEWLCSREELAEIPLSSLLPTRSSSSRSGSPKEMVPLVVVQSNQ
eukprot:jgi/Picsp_1/626/NSC_00622-R1_coatomer subunit beta -1